MKMSNFHISVNDSQIKLSLIHLWSIAIKLCRIFSKKIHQMSINGSDLRSQPKMSGFLKDNVRDPRSQDPDFLELWVAPGYKCTETGV
jgi:hypothetical protein